MLQRRDPLTQDEQLTAQLVGRTPYVRSPIFRVRDLRRIDLRDLDAGRADARERVAV
jgi:hypothetical protein